MSKILGQFLDHNNILIRQTQTTRVASDNRLVSPENESNSEIISTGNSSTTTRKLGNASEDDEKVAAKNSKREEK